MHTVHKMQWSARDKNPLLFFKSTGGYDIFSSTTGSGSYIYTSHTHTCIYIYTGKLCKTRLLYRRHTCEKLPNFLDTILYIIIMRGGEMCTTACFITYVIPAGYLPTDLLCVRIGAIYIYIFFLLTIIINIFNRHAL